MAYIEIFNVQRVFIGFYWFLFKVLCVTSYSWCAYHYYDLCCTLLSQLNCWNVTAIFINSIMTVCLFVCVCVCVIVNIRKRSDNLSRLFPRCFMAEKQQTFCWVVYVCSHLSVIITLISAIYVCSSGWLDVFIRFVWCFASLVSYLLVLLNVF